jgi:HEAT repeat protein
VAAIQALREIGPEAKMAVPALIGLLKDKERQCEAISTLHEIGPEAKAAVSALTELLRDKNVAFKAASALGEIGPGAKAAVPALIELLKEQEGRQESALALGRIGPDAKAAVPALTTVLGDKDASAASAAAWALGRIGPEARSAVGRLTELLKDKDARWEAATALGRIGPAAGPAAPAIAELLKEKGWYMGPVFLALGRIGPAAKAAVPALARYLKDKGSLDRSAAISVLAKIGPEAKDALPTLVGLLKDKNEDSGSRQRIAWVLTKIGPPSIPIFMELLKDRSEQTRSIAMWGLGEIGPEAGTAVAAIAESLKEKNATVRLAAVIALGKIGPKARTAGPAMIEVLKDKDALLRWAAIQALQQIGLEAASSIQALTALLADDNREVREAAAAALGTRKPEVQTTTAESRRIKQLIAELAKIGDVEEFSAAHSQCGFALIERVSLSKIFLDDEQSPKPSAAFLSLVGLGPTALPFLLESLDDKTPTNLTIRAPSVYGMWLLHALPGNELNAREARVLGDEGALHEDPSMNERQLGWYNVTIGDICLVAIGQIVNRPYEAVGGGQSVYVTSTVADDKLAAEVRALWGKSDYRQKLLGSFLADFETWSEFQPGAAVRLAYYFPDAADGLIIARLDQLEAAADASQRDSNAMLEEMLVQAVSWSKSPRLRAKLLEICRKTKHHKVLLAAMPAVGKENDELVFRRLTEHLGAVPKDNPQWYERGDDLLTAVEERFPDRAEVVFRDFLKPGTVSRCRTIISVLRYTRGNLAIPFLAPLLDDRRIAQEADTRDPLREPVLVCDEAAETLASHSKALKFAREGSREYLDRQIDAIRHRIAEMKPPK